MIYTDLTKKAIKIMFEAHKDQRDKSGLPYVFHPWHVAESMDDEASTCVALLHDIVEDTDMTFDDLAAEGFGDEIINALRYLTKPDDQDYMEYVKHVAENPLAVKVKLSDLRHNSDLSRLDSVDEAALSRREKYLKAIDYLESLE